VHHTKEQRGERVKSFVVPWTQICRDFGAQVKILFLYTALSIGGPDNVSGFEISFFIFLICCCYIFFFYLNADVFLNLTLS